MKKKVLVFGLILGALFLVSCSKNNPSEPKMFKKTGGLEFKLKKVTDEAYAAEVRISQSTLSYSKTVEFSSHYARLSFPRIEIGEWQIEVELFDNAGTTIYIGEGIAQVENNSTTTTEIVLESIQQEGDLEILLKIPTPEPTPPQPTITPTV